MASDVGLIGIGLLGTAIAERLMAARLRVVGYDPVLERRQWLQEQEFGASVESANGVVSHCHRVVLSLPDSNVVEGVIANVWPQLQSGTIFLDTTTGEPARTCALAERLSEVGVHWLDTTVAGSSEQTRRGEALLMVSGDRDALNNSEAILAAITPQRIFVGDVGSASKMKLVVNLALGLSRAVLAEALAFGEAYGLDPASILDALKAGPAYSRAMDVKGEKMLRRDFHPQARLRQHLKDVQLILDAGRVNAAQLPLTQVHCEILQKLADAGYGEEDNSAVLRAFLPDTGSPPN